MLINFFVLPYTLFLNYKFLETLAPCLKMFNSKFPSSPRTDVTFVGSGAFLEQNYGTYNNRRWHPICYLPQILCS